MNSQPPTDQDLDRARERLAEVRATYNRARHNLDRALERAIEERRERDDGPVGRRVARDARVSADVALHLIQ